MKLLTRQIIWAIRKTDAVLEYEAIFTEIAEAEAEASAAWLVEEESAEWERAVTLVGKLNDDAVRACNQLVADLVASGVDAGSNCGSDGDFSIWLGVEGLDGMGWSPEYIIGGPV
jgi:hypothetical protein